MSDPYQRGPQQPPQGYPPQYQQQPVYVAQYSYAPAIPQPKGMSVASMVLGIISIFFGLVVFLPIIGLILGIAGVFIVIAIIAAVGAASVGSLSTS